MQDRPSIHELLGAVARFLDDEIVPSTDGRRQFLVRVAINAIRMVDREIESSAAASERERAGLDALLGRAGDDDLRRRNEVLCELIRAGQFDDLGPGGQGERLLAHLREVTDAKLAVLRGPR